MQLLLFGSPESDWTPPDILPDLSGASLIAIDTETYDPFLKSKGPGAIRGDSYVAGIAIATDIGHEFYLPIAHGGKNSSGYGNLDANLVKRYCKKQFSNPRQGKVFANSMYDLEILKCDLGIDVAGPIYDVQVAEPLLDENQRSYSLERISRHYLGEGKDEDLLQRALDAFFPKGQNDKSSIAKLPAKFVGPYAAGDVRQTLRVFMMQLERLRRDSLESIFDLETRLIPCLFYMRMLGVPVDVDRAEKTMVQLQKQEQDLQNQLNHFVGLKVNVWAAQSLQAAYDQKGIQYPRLVTGTASFTKEWLAEQTDEVSNLVSQVRKVNRMWSTFVRNQVLDTHVNGRVHCQFHALRSDDGGAVTGRFSSSNPNLQQVPSPERDKVLAKFARSLFIPEQDSDWHCNDFSSVEPRIQLHYALLKNIPGAQEALKLTLEGYDFHTMTAELTGLPRKQAKVINLARSYGAGAFKIGLQMGVSEAEAREVLKQYDEKMPWLKAIIGAATARAEDVGYITTLMGRRRRFNMWEAGGFGRKGGQPLPSREAAIEAYGLPVQRSKTYTAFNGLVQGSAADVIKRVMVDVYESGILSEGAAMHLTVHDELDFSIQKDKRDTVGKRVVELMENSVKLRVPLKVDNEVGPSWGEVSK